ncbi:hypothetical protein AAL_01342 [Moelleriella libera RCEF 2490]|uniref:Uncharacterized protein n=1 Tax=Moelleriella libera RCEF 2490 TaxID=1081109 RepID=A0A166U3L4_9HYPO|nr:hypothetical protein AAL_01342 [Moelleriella libera RCEF 2490]
MLASHEPKQNQRRPRGRAASHPAIPPSLSRQQQIVCLPDRQLGHGQEGEDRSMVYDYVTCCATRERSRLNRVWCAPCSGRQDKGPVSRRAVRSHQLGMKARGQRPEQANDKQTAPCGCSAMSARANGEEPAEAQGQPVCVLGVRPLGDGRAKVRWLRKRSPGGRGEDP